MLEVELAVSINRSQRLSFTAGEDRVFPMLFKDGIEDLPLDLSSSRLVFAMPRAGGGTIKRRTGNQSFSFGRSHIENGLSIFSSTGHGLVSGDIVTIAPALPEVALPAPFNAGTNYLVAVQDEDSFGLLDEAGKSVALAAPAGDVAVLSGDDFVMKRPNLGAAELTLAAHVTEAVAVGQGLSYQVTWYDELGHARFFVGTNMLDVFAQPCP